MNETEQRDLTACNKAGMTKNQALEKLGWNRRTFEYRCTSLGLRFKCDSQTKLKQHEAQLRSLAAQGRTMDQIKKEMGVSRTTLYKIKKNIGVDVETERGRATAKTRNRIKKLLDKGKSRKEIQGVLGLSKGGLVHHLRRLR